MSRKSLKRRVLLTLLYIWLVLVIRPIRTKETMALIAKDKLTDMAPLELISQLEGPLIFDSKSRMKYTWYKVLEWGDTATISAWVYKCFLEDINIFKIINRNHKEPPDVAANEKWYYIYVPNGISDFNDIFPINYSIKSNDTSLFKLSNKQGDWLDSITFSINPEMLLYFLKKGHFQVVRKNEKYVTVDFYQTIARIGSNHNRNAIETRSANIFLVNTLEILIIPFDVPFEMRE